MPKTVCIEISLKKPKPAVGSHVQNLMRESGLRSVLCKNAAPLYRLEGPLHLEEARKILCYGFANEVIQPIKIAPVRMELEKLLFKKLR